MAYKSRLASDEADLLCDAVLALQNREECYRFFDDLLTTNEFISMGQRIAVARMLYNDEKYTDITDKTGASSATISRVKRCVSFGADGYTLVLQRLKNANNETAEEQEKSTEKSKDEKLIEKTSFDEYSLDEKTEE